MLFALLLKEASLDNVYPVLHWPNLSGLQNVGVKLPRVLQSTERVFSPLRKAVLIALAALAKRSLCLGSMRFGSRWMMLTLSLKEASLDNVDPVLHWANLSVKLARIPHPTQCVFSPLRKAVLIALAVKKRRTSASHSHRL